MNPFEETETFSHASVPDEATHPNATAHRFLYIVVYVILACLVFAPVAPWNGSFVPAGPLSGGLGQGDPSLMTWFLGWNAFALTHGHNIFFTNYLFSSQGTGVFSFNSIPLLGILAAPITLKLGPVVALNVLIRLAFAASATSMFLVLSSWCKRSYAFLGGLLYGFSPYIITQSVNHLNLTFLALLPPIVWCVHEMVVVRSRSPLKLGVALGVIAALQVYVSLEMITLLGIVLGVGVACYILFQRRHVVELLSYWVRGAVTAAVTFFCLTGYYLFEFFFGPGHLHGPIEPASSLQQYHSDLLGPLIPTANQLLTTSGLSHLSAGFVSSNITENGAYLGIPLVLILIYFGVRFRKNTRISAPLALTALALVLSMGDRLTIANHNLLVPMPELPFRFLPLLDNIVPARFGAIVILFASVTLALGTQAVVEIRRTSTTASTGSRWAICAVGLALLLSLLPTFPLQSKAETTPPGLDNILKNIPPGTEVLTYPYPTFNWTEPMVWQSEDHFRFRLLGGYLEPKPPPLLKPAFVQEFFSTAQDGTDNNYPPMSASPDPVAALKKFLRVNKVGAVVFWNKGVHPKVVRQLLERALGHPSLHEGIEFELWLYPQAG